MPIEKQDDQLPFRPITLADREAVERIRKAAGHEQASHSFCALYIWQQTMELSLYLEDSWFAVRCGEKGYFFPCGDARGKREFLSWVRRQRKPLLYLGMEDVFFLSTHLAGAYEATPDPAASEYLYDVGAQSTLTGKNFAHARKRLRRLLSKDASAWEVVDVEEQHIPFMRDILLKWYDRRKEKGEHDIADVQATLTLLDAHESLDLEGVLALRRGKPMAFMLGSAMSGRSFAVHSGKHVDIKGDADYLCMQHLCLRMLGRYSLINREEDLGLPGLRLRKREFRPVAMLDLWRADFVEDVP